MAEFNDDNNAKSLQRTLTNQDLDELLDERRDFYESSKSADRDKRDYTTFDRIKSLKGTVPTAERIRQDSIAAIRNHDSYLDITLRQHCSRSLNTDMLSLQLAQIGEAYAEVNELRAELAEVIDNKTVLFLRKRLLARYIVISFKESAAHQNYARAVMASAVADKKCNKTNALWMKRVECDCRVVRECELIKNDKSKNKTFVLRKKHNTDWKRARAILNADMAALQACWPSADKYEHLLTSGSNGDVNNGEGDVCAYRKVLY